MLKAIAFGKNLLIGLIILFIGGFVAANRVLGTTVYVDDEGLCDGNSPCYTTIGASINEASNGDTVYVYNGTYYENVIVNKSINLIGEGMNNTVIDAGATGSVVHIPADEVSISGFTIQHGEDSYHQAGISLSSDNNTIIGNIIQYNQLGIFAEGASNNEIVENTIKYNYESGIYLYDYSSNNAITGNSIIDNHHIGIILQFDCDSNRIEGNTVDRNDYNGVYVSASSNNNIISGNSIANSGYHGLYLGGSSNCIVEKNTFTDNFPYYGIDIYYQSNNNIIRYNNFTNNYHGINSYKSHYNTICWNSISGDEIQGVYLGMQLSESSHDTICGNTIINAFGDGIELSNECHDNILRGNTIIDSDSRGILVKLYSNNNNNIIYHNNLNNNAENACDGGSDTWDDGYPSGGNYWSNYTGVDNFSGPGQNIPGSDGIGDTPYPIPCGGNQDRYPLMYPLIRGDANGDGVIDISDVVYLLNYLFIHGPAPVPLEAGDANCDSVVDVSDVVYLLNYLFTHGPAPSCK